jgi:hypothetical protein
MRPSAVCVLALIIFSPVSAAPVGRVETRSVVDFAGRAWTPTEFMAYAAATLPPAVSPQKIAKNQLASRINTYVIATDSIYKSGKVLQTLGADLIISERARRLNEDIRRLERIPFANWDDLFENNRSYPHQDLLQGIKDYAPTFRAERVVREERGLLPFGVHGYRPWGIAFSPHDGFPGLVSLKDNISRTDLVHVALHEGIHQGDSGYTLGIHSLGLLINPDHAHAAWSAIIEGFTEWRTSALLKRVFEDGKAGKPGLPAAYLQALTANGLSDLSEVIDDFRNTSGYLSFLELAETMTTLPSGIGALDKYVSSGDVTGLYDLLGREVLASIGRIADSAARLEAKLDSGQDYLNRRLGLSQWLREDLKLIAPHRAIDELRTRQREELARRLLDRAYGAAQKAPFFFRKQMLFHMGNFDIDPLLSRGASPKKLLRALDQHASRFRRNPLPVDLFTNGWMASFHRYWVLGLIAGPFALGPTLAGECVLLALIATGALAALSRLSRNLDDFIPGILLNVKPPSKS